MTLIDKGLHFTWVYAGDGIHLSAQCLLIGWILHKRSCKGVSGRTQIIVALVDFLQFVYSAGGNGSIYDGSPPYYSIIMSTVCSSMSAILLYVMYGRYKKTIEKDYDTFWIEVLIILCGGVALVANPCYIGALDKSETDPLSAIFYTSVYLDSVSILPQVYFNFRTGSKSLCVSLYVLLSTISTFFYAYYLITLDLDTTDLEAADIDKLASIHKFTIFPECAQLATYALFFILLVAVPKYEKVLSLPVSEVESTTGSSVDGEKAEDADKTDPPFIIVTRPQLDRQQSLLETPFLKKTHPSSASLVSTNPDGSKPSPLTLTKALSKQSKPNIAKMMKLTYLKRARTSASSLFILGAATAPSTPEDEGFMMFKETALQSRRRRQEYIRRRSLPITSTETSANIDNELSTDRVQFQIGDDEDNDIKTQTFHRRKHRKTLSFEKFIAAQKLTLTVKNEMDKNSKNDLQASTDAEEQPTRDQMDESSNAQLPKPKVKISNEISPKKSHAGLKAAETSRRKSRRATVYHPGPGSPQTRNNWKMMATNLIGTGPIDVRRPSMQVLPSREEQHLDKRRRNRIFSVA